MKRFTRTFTFLIILTSIFMLISCPTTADSSSGGDTNNNSGSGDSGSGGDTSCPDNTSATFSLTTTEDIKSHKYIVLGITSTRNLSEVGVILSSNNNLTLTDTLKTEKAYYKRDLCAGEKTQVYLSLLSGFTLTDYTPTAGKYTANVDPTTVAVPRPGTQYHAYVFYQDPDGASKVEKHTFTTHAHPNTALTTNTAANQPSVTIRVRAGEFYAFPFLGRKTALSVMLSTINGVTVFRIVGTSLTQYDGSALPGNTAYTLTHANDVDYLLFHEIHKDDSSVKFVNSSSDGVDQGTTAYTIQVF